MPTRTKNELVLRIYLHKRHVFIQISLYWNPPRTDYLKVSLISFRIFYLETGSMRCYLATHSICSLRPSRKFSCTLLATLTIIGHPLLILPYLFDSSRCHPSLYRRETNQCIYLFSYRVVALAPGTLQIKLAL